MWGARSMRCFRRARYAAFFLVLLAVLGFFSPMPVHAGNSFSWDIQLLEVSPTRLVYKTTVTPLALSSATKDQVRVQLELFRSLTNGTSDFVKMGQKDLPLGTTEVAFDNLAPGWYYMVDLNVVYSDSTFAVYPITTLKLPRDLMPFVNEPFPGYTADIRFSRFWYSDPILGWLSVFAGTSLYTVRQSSSNSELWYLTKVLSNGSFLSECQLPAAYGSLVGTDLGSLYYVYNQDRFSAVSPVSLGIYDNGSIKAVTSIPRSDSFLIDRFTGRIFRWGPGTGFALWEWTNNAWLLLKNSVNYGAFLTVANGDVFFSDKGRLVVYNVDKGSWQEIGPAPPGPLVVGRHGELYSKNEERSLSDSKKGFLDLFYFDDLTKQWVKTYSQWIDYNSTAFVSFFYGPGGKPTLLFARNSYDVYYVPVPSMDDLGSFSVVSQGLGFTREGRGYINVQWANALTPESRLVSIYMHDGYQWRKMLPTSSTGWDSHIARIMPPDESLANKLASKEDLFIRDGQGLDLRDDPAILYKATAGEDAAYIHYYRLRAAVENPFGRVYSPEYKISLPNQTDREGPQVLFTINFGSARTNNRNVTLSVDARDAASGLSTIAFSNDGTNWSPPQTFTTSPGTFGWILSSGVGEKTVYAKVSDAAGNETIVGAKINLELAGTPTSLDPSLNSGYISSVSGLAGLVDINGASIPVRFVNKPIVKLSLNPGSNTGVRYSFDGVTWGPWESVSQDKYITLSPGQAYGAVFAQYKDANDNLSPVYWQAFAFDTSPPKVEAFWENGATITTTGSINLYVYARDDISPQGTLQVSTDGGSTWQQYTSPSIPVTFTTKGFHVVDLLVKDQAGNITEKLMSIVYQ